VNVPNFHDAQRAGIAAMLKFMTYNLELNPYKIDLEDKNKSSIELRLAKPLLIANKRVINWLGVVSIVRGFKFYLCLE
jgi:hypothetical protein